MVISVSSAAAAGPVATNGAASATGTTRVRAREERMDERYRFAGMGEGRKGFLLGAAAYGMWGAFPLYWPLLEPAGAVELLAHRVVWSAVVMALLVVVLNRARALRALLASPRSRLLLLLAAVVISVNWGVFIWGVNNGHVVETSLGYFINPLVTVLAGVVILGERLRPLQWGALGLAGVAVLGLAVENGRPPWVALA